MKTQKLPIRLKLRHARHIALASLLLSLAACGGGGGGGSKASASASTCGPLAKLVATAASLGTVAGLEAGMDLLVGAQADSSSTCDIEAAMDAIIV